MITRLEELGMKEGLAKDFIAFLQGEAGKADLPIDELVEAWALQLRSRVIEELDDRAVLRLVVAACLSGLLHSAIRQTGIDPDEMERYADGYAGQSSLMPETQSPIDRAKRAEAMMDAAQAERERFICGKLDADDPLLQQIKRAQDFFQPQL